LGGFSLALTATAFTAGTLRSEPALVLVSAVFLAVLSYAFLAVLFLSLLHRNAVRNAGARVITPSVPAGTTGRCVFEGMPASPKGTKGTKESPPCGKKSFFKLPGTILRYTLRLRTEDGRDIRHVFDPEAGPSSFPAPFRGAYGTVYDEFVIADLTGFFSLTFRLPHDRNPRLLVTPGTGAAPPDAAVHVGGAQGVIASKTVRTDNFTETRPYMPGDDPRRINWKLYSHVGDLFVREGGREPPPRSRVLIVVDCHADRSLYTEEEARRGVDMLCERALALARSGAARGFDVGVSYAGGKESWGKPEALAALLACPAASPPAAPRDFGASNPAYGMVVLALPRFLPAPETSALDRLVRSLPATRTVQALFLYEDEKFAEAAKECALFYRLRSLRLF
jgi:hypothetical protein